MNKKGFLPLLPLAVLIILAVGLVLWIWGTTIGLFSFLSSTKGMLFIAGMTILVLSLVYGFKTDWNKNKAKMTITFVIIGALMVVVSGSGLIQTEFGGTTYLSISNVEVVDSGSRIIVYGVAGTGAEDISINFNKDDLNKELVADGYQATKDVTGRILLTNQVKSFNIQQQSDEIFYKFTTKNIGRFTSCSSSSCSSQAPTGYTFAEKVFRSPTLVCVCLYKQNVGINSVFTGAAIDDTTISATVGSATGTLKPSQGQNVLRLNDGKTVIEWTGNLNNYMQVYTPQYSALYKDSQFTKLISPNAFSQYKDAIGNIGKCVGSSGMTYAALVNPVFFLFVTTIEQSETCISNFNTNVDNLLASKTTEYQNAVIANSVDFDSNSMNVDLKVNTALPTFKITLDAKSVGIVELKGKPDITNCVANKDIFSGDTYTSNVQVKNVGLNDGSFTGSVSCNGVTASGFSSEVLVLKGSTGNIPVQVSGEKLSEGIDKGTCTVTVTDRKSGSSDTCNFILGVKYQGGIICDQSSLKCLDSKTLRTCSEDGMKFTDKVCDKGCIVANDGVGGCLGEVVKKCSIWQESYDKTQKDYGFMYWRAIVGNPIVTTTPDCRTAGWFNVLVIGIIVVILGTVMIIMWAPQKPRRRR